MCFLAWEMQVTRVCRYIVSYLLAKENLLIEFQVTSKLSNEAWQHLSNDTWYQGEKKTFQSLLLAFFFWDCIRFFSNIFLPKSQGRLRKWWQMVGGNANVNCIQIQFFLEVLCTVVKNGRGIVSFLADWFLQAYQSHELNVQNSMKFLTLIGEFW